MNPQILITGGSGLLALNWALAVRDRYSVTLGLHERDITLEDIQGAKINLELVDQLLRAFETLQPQIVIHTAGLTSVEICETRPDLAQHINVVLATNVAKACEKLKLALVHISTDHLFPGDVSLVDEACPVAPLNVYGRTKAEAESRVLEACPWALVIRTNFYGWGTSYRQSFSDVIIKSLRASKEITLFQDVFYTPILAEVAIQATHDLLAHMASGIFHVVGDGRISKYEFGLKIAKEFSLDERLIKLGYISDQKSLVQRPRDMSLANKKTCKLIGRALGGVGEHITRLHRQEQNGFAQEIQSL